MQMLQCDIYDSKDSESPTWKGILAFIETNGDSDSMKEWMGLFPIALSDGGPAEKDLMRSKYLRVQDGRSGEIILTSRTVDRSGGVVIEFEGVDLFDWDERSAISGVRKSNITPTKHCCM